MIRSWRLLNARNRPDRTSTAPSTQHRMSAVVVDGDGGRSRRGGAAGHGTGRARRGPPGCGRGSPRGAGRGSAASRRRPSTAFSSPSCGPVGGVVGPEPARVDRPRPAPVVSRSADHATRAQMAPPDVPLRPTIRCGRARSTVHQPSENARGEGSVAAAALAGDGDLPLPPWRRQFVAVGRAAGPGVTLMGSRSDRHRRSAPDGVSSVQRLAPACAGSRPSDVPIR